MHQKSGWQMGSSVRVEWVDGTVSASYDTITVARGVLSGMWGAGVHLDLSHSMGGNAILVLPFNRSGAGSHFHEGTILSSLLVNNLPPFDFKFF